MNHVRDVLRRLRLSIRFLDAQPLHVFLVCREIPIYDFGPGLALPVRPLDDLVIHVRKVPNVLDPVFLILQIPADYVEGNGRAGMAEMAAIIDRHAADVHADPTTTERLEKSLLAREGVVDSNRHCRLLAFLDSISRWLN